MAAAAAAVETRERPCSGSVQRFSLLYQPPTSSHSALFVFFLLHQRSLCSNSQILAICSHSFIQQQQHTHSLASKTIIKTIYTKLSLLSLPPAEKGHLISRTWSLF